MRRGDSLDFEVLLQRCTDRAYNFALRLCGNDADAQDLVQEAFARAFEHRDRYDERRPFESWIFRIFRNIYIDSIRRYERRNAVSLDSQTPTENESSWEQVLTGRDVEPLDFLAKNEEERLLQKALNSLPIYYRTAVVLFDIE